MKLHPRVTRTAVELVKRFEGLRRRAARLPDGSWTIGFGHTLTAREGVEVSPEDAEALLYYDLSEVATKIEAWTFTPLNQNQFEALNAFAFNIGSENFKRSTVLKRVNEGQHLQAAAAMELWRKSDVDGEGLVVDALVRRRAAEKAHYLTPPEGFRPSPTQVLRPAFDFSVIEAAAQSHYAQRAAVIDAPLEGDHATASVESQPEPVRSVQAAPVGIAAAATMAAGLAVPVALAAEAAPAPALIAPEPMAEEAVAAPVEVAVESTAPAVEEPAFELAGPTDEPAPAAEVSTVEAPVAAPLGFRGFEPPPARYLPPMTEQPVAANEYAQPVAAEPVERPPEFNLFNQPLAPPPPPAAQEPVRTMRLRDDETPTYAEAEPDPAPASTGGLRGLLQDRMVLFGSIGCLGVALFASTIFSMLTGKATLAHLLIGFLGVLLITVAGVFFLMRRMAPPAAHQDHGVDDWRLSEPR